LRSAQSKSAAPRGNFRSKTWIKLRHPPDQNQFKAAPPADHGDPFSTLSQSSDVHFVQSFATHGSGLSTALADPVITRLIAELDSSNTAKI
jgi:hypothetical protein